jgi:glycosyltransferase involved in cell wall biosynthesis
VVAAGAGAIPEVVSEAGRLIQDPMDVGELAAALDEVTRDAACRARYIEAGLERAEKFSWERAAAAYLDIYRSLARKAGGEVN